MAAICSNGLPVIISGLELLDNGFLSISLDVEEVYLPRSHADRGFDLHVSIGYIQDYDNPTTALKAALRLHNRWSGRWQGVLPRLPHGKSWEGTLAGVMTCSLVSLMFWLAMPGLSPAQFAGVVLMGGLAGGLAELAPWPIDDNFTIPVLSGILLWIGCALLGIPL